MMTLGIKEHPRHLTREPPGAVRASERDQAACPQIRLPSSAQLAQQEASFPYWAAGRSSYKISFETRVLLLKLQYSLKV